MKRKNPLVSVIIPTRNRFKLLKRSINSVLSQSYKNIEVIVIDDASKDKTPEFLRSIKDKRLKFIRLKKQKGQVAARNIGLKKTKGELIAFNDDDDVWYEKKLEEQVEALAKPGKKNGVVYVRIKRIKGKDKQYLPGKEARKKEGNVQKELFLENFVDLPAAVVKRECFEKVGLFDEKLPCYEDWELWLRISQYFDFKYLSKTLVDSVILPSGITSNKKVVLKASEIIFQKHEKEIKKDKQVLATWQFRLGDLYYHQERMEQARNLFFQAFKNYPLFKYFRAIIKTILGKRVSEGLISGKIRLITDLRQ